jgi:hypothetical protein
MNKNETECLGCMYIFHPQKENFDAEVYMWVRKSAYDEGLDPELYNAVKDWISTKWPFKKVAYPGRDIDWKAWESQK